MKIFEIQWTSQDEKEWIAANTIIEALRFYCETTSFDLFDFENGDDIVEIPKNQWDKMYVTNSDYDENDPDSNWTKITFEEFVKGLTTPAFIAGTMYC